MHGINNQLIINIQSLFLQNHLKLKFSQNNKALPNIYWVLKLHKSPRKTRFIIIFLTLLLRPLTGQEQ